MSTTKKNGPAEAATSPSHGSINPEKEIEMNTQQSITTATAGASPTGRKVTDLSFVSDRGKRGSGRSFWTVQPTGDPYHDDAMGCRLALEFLEHEHAEAASGFYIPLLGSIVDDMPTALTTVERAFLTTVGLASVGGLGLARHAAARRLAAAERAER